MGRLPAVLRRDLPIAVVEAKEASRPAENGVQQVREYAEILGLKFAYAANGQRVIEIDITTGQETEIDRFPTPEELWRRLCGSTGLPDGAVGHYLEPFNLAAGKVPRYYQRIAIQHAMEAVPLGKTRVLLTRATGTGKTAVAFQICWKLWSSPWNRTAEHRRPKILYLADRNILVDDPMAKMFAPFGEARHKITSGDTSHSRDMYFGIYQALSPAGNEVFRQYRPDFFDLVIVDECHRGSSRADSDLQDEAAAEPRKFYVDGGHVESFEHLAAQGKSPEDRRTLQQESLFGQEANPLPYMLAPMNLLLHGLEAPLIAYGNTLAQKLTDIGDRDRVDLILTNPPFGGEEEAGIKANFPADRQTAETALLFLQCIMRKLRRPGRGSKEGGRPARRNCRPG